MSPYRIAAPPAVPTVPWWKRWVCMVRDHRWGVVGINPSRAWNLGHLHPLAGRKAVCDYCGAVWDDLNEHREHGSPS